VSSKLRDYDGALARNRWLDRSTGAVRQFLRLVRARQLKLPGRIDASTREHRALIEAMRAGEPSRAEHTMHDHLMAQLAALKAVRALERQAATHERKKGRT